MSTAGIVATASPLVPASLLVASLRSRRALDVLAPMQFLALVGGAVVAMTAPQPQGTVAAATAVALAMAGLLITVLRKDCALRRAAYSIDWEKFERDFRFYAIVADYL